MSPTHACPLPRWPRLMAALRDRGLKVHHLAVALGVKPSLAFAWVYGHEDMPPDKRRLAESFAGLEPGELG